MTGAEERALLHDYLQTCERLRTGFDRAAEGVEALMPVDAAGLDALAPDDENLILAFLKRFEQFEDALDRTMKTVAQIMALGRIERLQPRDVAYRAESFGIVDDAERWSEAVRTRNALAYEYPLRPDKRAAQINNAWHARATLLAAWQGLRRFVAEERLIP